MGEKRKKKKKKSILQLDHYSVYKKIELEIDVRMMWTNTYQYLISSMPEGLTVV